MSVSRYLCFISGENFEKSQKLHSSSQRRLTAFALAIHIPVILWAVTGYVISSRIFHAESPLSLCAALFCALAIYLVERIVLATPKNLMVNGLRVVIGFVIALIGSSTVDLVIFDREITEQLQLNAKERIQLDYENKTMSLLEIVNRKKLEWQSAQDAASCEANGTCGSRVRSVGPVYRELARHADTLRRDYLSAQAKYDLLTEKRNFELDEALISGRASLQAGLLSRIKALHEYTFGNAVAFIAWILFFSLVLLFELMVVIAKLVFGDTIDDELDQIRETISQAKARSYMEAITSPVSSAREMAHSVITV
jgi:hypothetical protein